MSQKHVIFRRGSKRRACFELLGGAVEVPLTMGYTVHTVNETEAHHATKNSNRINKN